VKAARLQVALRAMRRIRIERGRKAMLEFESESSPHYADAVDGIDESLRRRIKDTTIDIENRSHVLRS